VTQAAFANRRLYWHHACVERSQIITALMPQAEGNPAVALRLAKMLQEDGQGARATALAARILDWPGAVPPLVLAEARMFVARGLPSWHFNIVRDLARNDIYDMALRRAVKPGMRVLEIGTGTGLLAMMAARAGAAEVITCEGNPAAAAAAEKVIAANGYADRVRVIPKLSTALDVAADLGGPCDLLVSEIVSHDLLREFVLPAHEDAVARLIRPGAPVIPPRGRIRVALADAATKRFDGATVPDFDLGAFNMLLPPERRLFSNDPSIVLRSDPADLFAFDFATARKTEPASAEATCVARGGTASGIIQWIAVELDDDLTYENAPDAAILLRSAWKLRFFDFVDPIETIGGETYTIRGRHDRHRVEIWRG
jgi:type II protein arginine methyltransferase